MIEWYFKYSNFLKQSGKFQVFQSLQKPFYYKENVYSVSFT